MKASSSALVAMPTPTLSLAGNDAGQLLYQRRYPFGNKWYAESVAASFTKISRLSH